MKILEIVGEINGGGVGAVVLNYLKHMDMSQIECDILAFRIEEVSNQLYEEEFRKLNVKVIFFDHRNCGYKEHFKEYDELLKHQNYDIVHCHFGIWSTPYLALAKKNKVGVRIAHSHIAKEEYSGLKRVILNCMKPILNFCVTDRFACGEAAGRYLWGKKKFYIMNNAIDLEDYKFSMDDRKEYRKKLCVDDDCILLGHVGRFCYQKNQEYLIDIARVLKQDKFNFKMILVGNGEDYNLINNRIKKNKLDDFVYTLGNRNDVSKLMHAMDIFLLPSRYEGLPVVAIEAQTAGLKCILSDDITEEVQILENVVSIKTENNINQWINEIEEFSLTSTYKRERCYVEIRSYGYDINCEGEKLRKVYSHLMQRK